MFWSFCLRLCSDEKAHGFWTIAGLWPDQQFPMCFYFAEKLPDQLCPSLEGSKTNHMFCVALLVPIRKGSRSRKILQRLRRHREAWVPRREAWGDPCTFGVWSQSLWWVPRLPLGRTWKTWAEIFPLQVCSQSTNTDLSSPTVDCRANNQIQIVCIYEQCHLISYRIKESKPTIGYQHILL